MIQRPARRSITCSAGWRSPMTLSAGGAAAGAAPRSIWPRGSVDRRTRGSWPGNCARRSSFSCRTPLAGRMALHDRLLFRRIRPPRSVGGPPARPTSTSSLGRSRRGGTSRRADAGRGPAARTPPLPPSGSPGAMRTSGVFRGSRPPRRGRPPASPRLPRGVHRRRPDSRSGRWRRARPVRPLLRQRRRAEPSVDTVKGSSGLSVVTGAPS